MGSSHPTVLGTANPPFNSIILILERSGLILMLGSLATFFTLFAQAPAAAAKPPEASPYLQILPWLAAPFIFYFVLLRPQMAQERKRKELLTKLKKNDKVLTTAGMYGTVLSVDEKNDRVQLRLDDDGKVKVTFTKASIVRVVGDPAESS